MLQRMKGIKEGGSTLLDNSMVLYGSGIRDGNAHATKDEWASFGELVYIVS